jgi:hypothetical protein
MGRREFSGETDGRIIASSFVQVIELRRSVIETIHISQKYGSYASFVVRYTHHLKYASSAIR